MKLGTIELISQVVASFKKLRRSLNQLKSFADQRKLKQVGVQTRQKSTQVKTGDDLRSRLIRLKKGRLSFVTMRMLLPLVKTMH